MNQRAPMVALWVLVLLSLAISGLILWQALMIRQQAYETLGVALVNVRLMRSAEISTTIALDQNVPVASDVPLNTRLNVPISTTIPIRQSINTTANVKVPPFNIEVPVPVSIPVSLDVPINMQVPVQVNQRVPFSTTVPIHLQVPVRVKLIDAGLDPFLTQLEQQVRDWRENLNAPLFPQVR